MRFGVYLSQLLCEFSCHRVETTPVETPVTQVTPSVNYICLFRTEINI
jgi:hypothetical protein